jgi:hypothetical protein
MASQAVLYPCNAHIHQGHSLNFQPRISPILVIPLRIITTNPTKLTRAPMLKIFINVLSSFHLDINYRLLSFPKNLELMPHAIFTFLTGSNTAKVVFPMERSFLQPVQPHLLFRHLPQSDLPKLQTNPDRSRSL